MQNAKGKEIIRLAAGILNPGVCGLAGSFRKQWQADYSMQNA